MKKTYITTMPDKAGAFLKAGKVIAENGGNIIRVNYNKSLDTHTLFLDVQASKSSLDKITAELKSLNYLASDSESKVILIVLTLPDIPGAIEPALEIIDKYEINISYMNSQENGTGFQHFKMGLFIDNTSLIKKLLDELSKICEVNIIDYNVTDKNLDSTVFYLSFAHKLRNILSLNQKQTNEIIINTNKIMQFLDEKNESPLKTFDYVTRFAEFIISHKGKNFNPVIKNIKINDNFILTSIEPPCGSNTYIIEDLASGDLLFIDCGFACFKDEMEILFNNLYKGFEKRKKSIILTHADIDHSGILEIFDTTYTVQSDYDNFKLQAENKDDFREQNLIHNPYCKLSKIISGYNIPDLSKIKIIGEKKDNDTLSYIDNVEFNGLVFKIYEDNGGHIKGDTVIVCEKHKLIFTGDIIVNIKGFSKDQYAFNKIAPYLMTSVNVNSAEASVCRDLLFEKYSDYLICPGHGDFIFKK